jgi:hypothetical protein
MLTKYSDRKITSLKDDIYFLISSDEINRMYVILMDKDLNNSMARKVAKEFLDEMIERKTITTGGDPYGGLIFFD